MAKRETVIFETCSVFHSLGLPDADDLQLRSEIIMKLGEILADRKIKLQDASVMMGMTRSQVSGVVRGEINKFSVEELTHALYGLR